MMDHEETVQWWRERASTYFTDMAFSFSQPDLIDRLEIQPESRVLEIGFGYGRELSQFCRLSKQVYGVDLSRDHCEIASRQLAGQGLTSFPNLCEYDGRRLPFTDNYFDVVYSCYVLQHMSREAARELLTEALRVSKPNGRVLMEFFGHPAYLHPKKDIFSGVPGKGGMFNNAYGLQNIRSLLAPLSKVEWIDPQPVFAEGEHFNNHWACVSPLPLRVVDDCPHCSITMSTRNKCQYLNVTLASIFKQDVPFSYEVIVVDDGSTDDTRSVCEKYDVNYHYIQNDRYRNPSVARNVAFRAAQGDVIIAQSDDIAHALPNSIESLVAQLRPGSFVAGRTHNYSYADGQSVEFIQEYCGPMRPAPYFFFGALYKSDLYAVGGYDEEFIEPCYDDDWFANCLIKERKLRCDITPEVLAHHQNHDYVPGSHAKESISKDLYGRKILAAEHTGHWLNSNGAWRITPLAKQVTIPKTMNFFWVGDTISWMRYMTLHSFSEYHPGWDIVLHQMPSKYAGDKTWDSIEVQEVATASRNDYSRQVEKLGIEHREWRPPDDMPLPLAPSHACDLFQWDLLANNGGFYADMDILFVAPLPYEKVRNANAVFCHTNEYMAIGLCAAAPREQLLRDIHQSAKDNYSPAVYQSTGSEAIYRLAEMWPNWGTIARVGPNAIDALRRRYPDIDITVLVDATVYPWHFLQVGHIFNEAREVPPQCCGIHWFGGDALAQEWNGRLTHCNYRNYDNTFTRYAAKAFP